MTTLHAGKLTVHHDDDTTTEYQNVKYALTSRGVTVLNAKGEHLADHADVLRTETGQAP